MTSPAWLPRYTLTPTIARWLMEIEAARAVVEHTPLPPQVEAELRRQARLRSTHYSTSIEGVTPPGSPRPDGIGAVCPYRADHRLTSGANPGAF